MEKLIKLYNELNITKYDFSKVVEDYKNFRSSVRVTCLDCGIEFITSYNSLIRKPTQLNEHCPNCKQRKMGLVRTPELKELLEGIEDKITVLKERGKQIEFRGFVLGEKDYEVPRKSTKLRLFCKEHNLEWTSSTYNSFVLSPGVCCPECGKFSKTSNSERECYTEILKYINDPTKVLLNHLIEIDIPQHFNKSGIIFTDIFIDLEKPIIFEFDGEQHYRYVPFMQRNFHRYLDQVRRDEFLNSYCKKNNIQLVRITWKDSHRISEIIRSFFMEGKDITEKVFPILPPAIIN